MTDLDPLPLLRRADAVQQGYSDAELARLVRRRDLQRLQRGTYTGATDAVPSDAVARHALLVRATVAGLRAPSVVCSGSAAAVHGLPLWGVRLDRVHLHRRPPAGGNGSSRLRLHVGRLDGEDETVLEGLPITTVTRTVVDVARSASFEAAVVTADAALRLRWTSKALLQECLGRLGAVPGVRAAARVVAFANGLSESVGESRSRVLIHRMGLPVPDLQVRVLGADRSDIGRCDFGWEQHRTIGEFDGRIKYGRLLRPGQDPGDVVFDEKRREDAIRDQRWEVTRWTWDDLRRPAAVAARIRRAFARGRR